MKKTLYYFLGIIVLSVVISRLFIYSADFKSEDTLHQENFNMRYGIFSILQPQDLDFAEEKIPVQSPEIWERLDGELLRNTYWQSNTMLYFKRSHKYFPVIEPILEAYNIPDDFKYLAVIESGLDNVVSPSGAAGFWQIMKKTGREHGLEINREIDERYNLEKATVVACEYLQKAYDKFGSWTLAAASYNMGRSGLSKRMEEQKVMDYYSLHLNSETGRYMYRIIAVKEILSNPKKYGFVFREKDLYTMPVYKNIEVDSTIANLSDFARSHSINYKLLKEFNPWLRSSSLPDKSRKKYILKIPIDTSLMVFDLIENELDSL